MKCKRCGHETPVQATPGLLIPDYCNSCVRIIVKEFDIRKDEIDADLHNDNSGKAF